MKAKIIKELERIKELTLSSRDEFFARIVIQKATFICQCNDEIAMKEVLKELVEIK